MNVRERSGSKSQYQSRPHRFQDRKRGDPNHVNHIGHVSSPQTWGRFYRAVGARLHCKNHLQELLLGPTEPWSRAGT